jgi:hypothetical protein
MKILVVDDHLLIRDASGSTIISPAIEFRWADGHYDRLPMFYHVVLNIERLAIEACVKTIAGP